MSFCVRNWICNPDENLYFSDSIYFLILIFSLILMLFFLYINKKRIVKKLNIDELQKFKEKNIKEWIIWLIIILILFILNIYFWEYIFWIL